MPKKGKAAKDTAAEAAEKETAVEETDAKPTADEAEATEPAATKAEEEQAASEKRPLSLEEAQDLAQYDLTSRMAPFLDGHLIFHILAFLQEIGMYKQEDITRAEIELLSSTNMIDFAKEKYEILGEEAPDDLEDRRDQIIETLTNEKQRLLPLLAILEDDEAVKQIQEFTSITQICEKFDLSPDMIGALFRYAKTNYDCGDYGICGLVLKHYATFTEKEYDKYILECMWGKVASALLSEGFEEAAKHICDLNAHLEKVKMTKSEVLMQKTWLLHWALFPIFSCATKDVPGDLLDFFLSEKSLSVISLSCPHLFRYVGVCLILHKRIKHLVKESVWIIANESTVYTDPVTRFLLALHHDLDFGEAQMELQKCQLVCKADYFLRRHWGGNNGFEENARLLIFETYCRIHQCINIGMIASRLNMSEEEAELWIVKLIQNAQLNARIDSEKSRVVMCKAPPSVYQQVIEKTKNLSFRSTMLLSNLEKKENERNQASSRV